MSKPPRKKRPEQAMSVTEDLADLPLPEESGPERTCIVTRVKGSKESLLRFVISPEQQIVPDIRARLPGRGAWIAADAATLAAALKKRSFARAFKAEVSAMPSLVQLVDDLLQRDALQALSLANKAGLVVCGATKVEDAIATKPLAGLLHATEAAQDGLRKLDAALRRRFGETGSTITRVHLFATSQLDLALGRTHVIHAALSAGAAGEGFIKRSQRLEHYRGPGPLSNVGQASSA